MGFFFSYSFSLVGLEGGDQQSKSLICWKDMVKGGCELLLAEEAEWEFPLKMVLKDGSKMDLQAISGSMEVVFRTGEEECLASERDLNVSKDNFKRLLTFSNSLGLLVEGREKEIMELFQRLKL